MSESLRSRRIIALAAAYVVALQGLLLPLSIGGGPFRPSLCAASVSVEGSQGPVNHDTGCPCAAGCGAQCCVQTLAGPPQVTFAPSLTGAIVTPSTPAIIPVIRLAGRNPQIPRAPPAT